MIQFKDGKFIIDAEDVEHCGTATCSRVELILEMEIGDINSDAVIGARNAFRAWRRDRKKDNSNFTMLQNNLRADNET